MRPRITVCIVVFNGYAHIAQALASVAAQTYPDTELLVIDGGSTDGTLDILKKYASSIAHIVSEPDKGIYDAMNKACAMAQGDWLIFLGCDDVLLNSLSDVAPRLKDASTVYYGDVIVKSTGRLFGGRFSKYRLMQVNICHQAIFYPRNVYKKYLYKLQYRFLADYEYNLRLIGHGIKFEYINVPVAVFDITGASTAGDADFERDRLQIIRENFGPVWVILKRVRMLAVAIVKRPNSRTTQA